jgi:hypothetical protein
MDVDDENAWFEKEKPKVNPIKVKRKEVDNLKLLTLQNILMVTLKERWRTYASLLQKTVHWRFLVASGKTGDPTWSQISRNLGAFYENDTFPDGWSFEAPTRLKITACQEMVKHFIDADAGNIKEGPIVKFRDGPTHVLLGRAQVNKRPSRKAAQHKYEDKVSDDENEPERGTDTVQEIDMTQLVKMKESELSDDDIGKVRFSSFLTLGRLHKTENPSSGNAWYLFTSQGNPGCWACSFFGSLVKRHPSCTQKAWTLFQNISAQASSTFDFDFWWCCHAFISSKPHHSHPFPLTSPQ